MIKKIVLLFLTISIVLACSKDDICTGETPTTPKLIIIFKSSFNSNLYKSVTNLTVTTIIENDTIDIIKSMTTDSIAIPLNAGVDFSKYQFISNNTTNNLGNTDQVTFSYQRENVYVNKACAFKTNYHELLSELEIVENENWIQSMIVQKTNVIDEIDTHVIIYH